MKLLTALLLAALLMSGCAESDYEPYSDEESSKNTTLEILDNLDTLTVSIIGNKLYVLEENKVQYKCHILTNTKTSVISTDAIVGMIFIIIVLLLLVFSKP